MKIFANKFLIFLIYFDEIFNESENTPK